MAIKIIAVTANVSDLGSYDFLDEQQNLVHEHDGYVPDFFPEKHYGDYLILEIEADTGRILNWVPPTQEQIQVFFDKKA